MPENIGEIAARLAAERGEVLSFPEPPKKRKANGKQLAHIEEILLQLLNHEESGTVRIAAAKVLLERLGAPTKEEDEARKREAEERSLALSEAHNILAEFAAAKLASLPLSPEMDIGKQTLSSGVYRYTCAGNGFAARN